MKRKIAIFANGWSNEYLELVLEGVRKKAQEESVDLFIFANYSAGGENDPDNVGSGIIFTLPSIEEFDGVLLMGNTINMSKERKYLREQILEHNIPAISLEYEMDGIPYIGTDTYQGIYQLILHLLEGHHAKDFVFVGGPQFNRESEERKKAVEDALKTVDLELRDEQIIEGDWSYFVAYEKFLEYVENHNKLPDAIICANDEMAIGVCTALDYKGIRVPYDVIVTGCDCLKKGQEFFPILSTVGREWDTLGYRGMKLLLERINGDEIPERIEMQSSPVFGESCGCEVSEEKANARLRSIISNHRGQREETIHDWQLRYIDELFTNANSVEELKHSMEETFQRNHTFEGKDFLFCIVDGYFDEKEAIEELKPGELSERMEVFVNLVDGKAVPTKKFRTKKLLPKYDPYDKEPHTYLFLPLHLNGNSIGYIVQQDQLSRLYDQSLFMYLKRVSQDLERVNQNIRLEKLNRKLQEVSVTDALTGLLNRTGFDVKAHPYLQQCQRDGKNSAMVFADINYMKKINDLYGHVQGDMALCTVSEAIKRTLPPDWIAVRYGGDEFIMVGQCKDEDEAERIRKMLELELEMLKTRRRFKFNLSVSLGYVIMRAGEKDSLEEYLKRADEAMYLAKQKYHEEEEMKL